MGELAVRKTLVAVGLLVAVALAGCSSPSPSSPAAIGPAATTTPAGLPTPTRFAGDLRTLLLEIPPTATKTADKDVPDGTLTVQQAAKVFDDPAAGVARLTAAGYQRGAEVQWLEADGSAFAPAVEISGVPGGAVYARTTISSNNRWFTEAVFTRHDISVELFVTGPKKLGPEKTIALAQAQYALLP